MNKLYTSALACVAISGAALAQNTQRDVKMPYAPVERIGHQQASAASADRAIIWQDDFGTPANWVTEIAPGAFPDVEWQIGVGLESTGQYGTPAIQSTTADNGYAMLCSDCGANEGGDVYEQNFLTTADPINLSGYPNVILEFQTMYRRFNNEQTYVAISTDGVNWPVPPSDTATVDLPAGLYPVWYDGELTQGIAVANPTVKRINISAAAGGQSTVWVRFYWYGVWGYAWYVDDVNIFEQFNYDRGMESSYFSHTGSGDEYARIPANQLSGSINVGARVTNYGVNPQTNIVVHVETRDASNAVVLTHNTAAIDLDPELSEFLDEEVSIGAWAPGTYTTTFWVTSDQEAEDQDAANDTIVRVIEVTEVAGTNAIYSLDGLDVYPIATIGSTGTNSFTDNPDGIFCMTNYVFEQNATAYGVWVGIASTSAVDGQLIATLLDSAEVVPDQDQTSADGDVGNPLVQGNDYFLTQADIDAGFVYLPFQSPTAVTPGIGYMAGVELYSNNGSSNVRIKDDLTIPQTVWGSAIFLPSGNPFGTFSNGNAFLIRLALDPTVSINEREELSGVNVFPNPSSGLVNLVFTVPGTYAVELIDALGKVVAQRQFNGTTTMDMSAFAKGTYSLRISNEVKSTVQRVTLN